MNTINIIISLIFIFGYLAIALEYRIKINKTALAILMAVFTWSLLFLKKDLIPDLSKTVLDGYIGNASQIIFFLLSAMTLVELIDSHGGFKIINKVIKSKSQKTLLWIVGLIAFFISSVLDNLTTTILMISILKKLVPDNKQRLVFGSIVVIAANAGGAWTPIGDVTTTMLWIQGQLTSINVMKALFLPSLFSLVVTILIISITIKGKIDTSNHKTEIKSEPGSRIVLILGLSALLFVPVFHYITGLPPFMGMFIGLGILWIITDLMHHKHESRKHLRVPYVLTKIDTSGVLFFLAILLAINSLEMVGILKSLAIWLDKHVGNLAVVATLLGFLSSIVDNVPLVAACIGMYNLSTFPTDSNLWHMIAYTAGTGGSILLIGSAAGVALMGLEKVDFIWYMKKISLVAVAGYLAGMALYLLLNTLYV